MNVHVCNNNNNNYRKFTTTMCRRIAENFAQAMRVLLERLKKINCEKTCKQTNVRAT